ncbi:hypothetical protein DFH06DRAFT_1342430 [Mycena polygramma]|nr:hypothetical protein DFH06DRAFT_1342430 [Mycena polygramma]
MSANPAHYNTADRVRFENYADHLRDHFAGRRSHPGPTPIGYREFFRIHHKYAPVPEDYAAHAKAHAKVPRTQTADITMSAAALGTILDSQQKLMNSVIAMTVKPERPAFVDRFSPPGHVGGGSKRARPYRKRKHQGDDDIASDVATAGGLTDDEDLPVVVNAEDVPDEVEFNEEIVLDNEDNGFNMAGV